MKLKKSELNYINNSLHDITNETVIVTGANSGIGFAICQVLFKTSANNNTNPNIFYLYSEPGIANTGIIRNFPKWIQKAGYVFMSLFMHSNIMGVLSTCYVATNYVANGDSFVPKHMFHTKGLPIRYNILQSLFMKKLSKMVK